MSLADSLDTIHYHLARLMRENGDGGDALAEVSAAFEDVADRRADLAARLDRLEQRAQGIAP